MSASLPLQRMVIQLEPVIIVCLINWETSRRAGCGGMTQVGTTRGPFTRDLHRDASSANMISHCTSSNVSIQPHISI